MNYKKKNLLRGSTIIELLIAVMVVGLIVTAVANAATFSIKNTGESRYRQVATILGQQVIEFIRSERNRKGLLNLKNILVSGSYCFSTIPDTLDITPDQGACTQSAEDSIQMAGTDFQRNVVVSVGAAPEYSLLVTTTVSWLDGSQTKQIELVQEFENTN